MLLAYVDESYTARHYWIAALICHDVDMVPLTAALDSVVAKAASEYRGVSENAELHGYPLFHGEGDWAALKTMARARIGIYNGAFEAIGSSGARIIIRGVDRAGLKRRYAYPNHPHVVVLEHLLERIDDHAAARGEVALVIADEVDQADEHRRNLWWAQRYKTSGYRARQLKRVVDTIHFAPSRASRLVQAADLVAFLHCRISSGVESDPRAIRANTALWARIEPRVAHSWCWHP